MVTTSRNSNSILVSLALAATFCCVPVPAGAQQCPAVVWADEFGGAAVDTTRWSFQLGDGCDIGLCGWGNNELQYYKAENATVGGGTLKITARRERVRSREYTSARIRTLGKGEWTFGRFEARLKLPVGKGIWPAFWQLPTDEVYGGWPQSGEIDVMENIGSEPSTVHGTIHFGAPFPNNRSSGGSYTLHAGARFTDAFHTFAIEKAPGVIRWLVDDVLYSTKTAADTAPHAWPFDERFHFLLNLAVGGNWPGSPDASTVFPQVLEADFVRVYDGYLPYIAGDRVVAHREPGVAYSIGNVPGNTAVSWTVPAGATIVSGQGTPVARVDWGAAGGSVTASFTTPCGARQLALDVVVEPAYAYDFSFENFDQPANVTFDAARTSGTLVEVPNPAPDGVNGSAFSGRYTRDAAAQYDVLFYDVEIGDAGPYVSKQKKLFVDVYTSAPVGSQILLQLEDGATATAGNYPTGRHSRYQAFTSAQNRWERLELAFLDRPDPGAGDGAVDDMVLLFAPDSFTGDTYTFDNLDSYVAEGGGGAATRLHVADVAVGTQAAGKGSKRGTARVTVVDDLGAPVAGATVSGRFSGAFNETASGTTGADGAVSLVTSGTKSGGVSFSFCVEGIAHPTLSYDPAANVETCAAL